MDASKGSAKTALLLQIAQGSYYGADFDWERPAPKALSKKPACSRLGRNGFVVENVKFRDCVMPHYWSGGPGCGWWRFEPCDVYEVDDFILTQPDVFLRTVHALSDPCIYLPNDDDLRHAKNRSSVDVQDFSELYRFLDCGKGVGHVPVKVIINIRNDKGDVVAQYKHLPPDAPTFLGGVEGY